MTLEDLCEKYDIEIEVTQDEELGVLKPRFTGRVSKGARLVCERESRYFGVRKKELRQIKAIRIQPTRDLVLQDLACTLSHRMIRLDKDGTVVKLPKIIHIP